MDTITGTGAATNEGTRDGEPQQAPVTDPSRNATDDSARNGQPESDDDLEKVDDPAKLRDLLREMRRGEQRRNAGYNAAQTELRQAKERLAQIDREKQQGAPADQRISQLESDLKARDEKITRMEQERKDERTDNAVMAAARRLNATDPEDVARLIDRDELQIEDDGKVTNAEKVVREFLKRKPHFQGRTQGNADAGNRGASGRGSGHDMNDILRSARRGRVVETKQE